MAQVLDLFIREAGQSGAENRDAPITMGSV
jgi:hypothetical protein